MGYLEELRNEIDNVDEELVELFEKRMEIVLNVAKYKKENNLPILNNSREEEVIKKNINYLKNKNLQEYLTDFFVKLMNVSKEYQKEQINNMEQVDGTKQCKLKVGFQGTTGSFSEQALVEYFGEQVEVYPVKQFEDVFKELKNDKIHYGVLPIENSSTGAITEVYDLLRKYGLYIVGSTCVKVDHNLLGIKGTELKDVKEVYSHTQAFKQCNEFLHENSNWTLIPYYNTAISAELIKNENCKYKVAIGSKKASEVYGLDILKANINNSNNNYTRFIIIGKNLETKNDDDTISIVISSPHKVGALYNSLRAFKENNLNMIRIESRPVIERPWEYFFYIDFQGNLNDNIVKEAISYIQSNSSYFKILGNYKNS